MGTSAMAMWTPPKITSVGRRGNTSRNTVASVPSGAPVSMVVLASRRSASRAGVAIASRSQASAGVASSLPSSLKAMAVPGAVPSTTVATTAPASPRAAARTRGLTVGSTYTLMVPPQARPTSQAFSSLTP